MFKKLAAIAAVAATALLGFAAPASATPALTGTLPAPTAENQTVPLAFNLTGASWTDVLVTITVVDGGVTVDAAGSVVASSGYVLTDGTSSSQSFHGPLADVVSTLASGVDWLTPSTAGQYTLDFTLTVQEYVEGLSYNPTNGHYYLVPADQFGDPIEDTAENFFGNASAGDYVYAGITGYVAEINDQSENDFVAEFSGGSNIWIGGSAESSVINDFGPGSANDAQDNWIWIHSGTNFASGLDEDGNGADTADAVNGNFTSFAEGEPNGGNTGSEGCLVTNVGGDAGLWNDLTCFNTSHPAIIEFAPVEGAETAVLTLTDEKLAALAETGVDANGIALTAGLIGLAGAVAVAYRRRRA